jgi:hypothetical protein
MLRKMKIARLLLPALSCVVAIAGVARAQSADFALVTEGDLPGWRIGGTEYYRGKELYGYIDGGAEAVYEYGFEAVAVQTFTRGNSEIRADIYRMNTAEGAFGLFSVSTFNCPDTCALLRWNCIAPGTAIFARGRYFVQFVARDTSAETARLLRSACLALADRIGESDYEPPPLFSSDVFRPSIRALKFLAGPLAIQNNAAEWSEFFDGIDGARLWVVAGSEGGVQYRFARVTCPDSGALSLFLKKVRLPASGDSREWVTTTISTGIRAIRIVSGSEWHLVDADCDAERVKGLLRALTAAAR